MTPFTTFATALVLGLLIAAAFLFGGAPLLVLPIVVVPFFAFWLYGVMRRARDDRGIAEHRHAAETDKVKFTARDKQTLTR